MSIVTIGSMIFATAHSATAPICKEVCIINMIGAFNALTEGEHLLP